MNKLLGLSPNSPVNNVMSKRGYDNALRTRKSQENKKLIIDTLIQLLVEKKGGEVTFEAIAKRAKISERTIYRFFKDKTALHQEMGRYISAFLAEAASGLEGLDVSQYGKFAFELFDKHPALVDAYLYSRQGYEARRTFRKKLNETVVHKINEDKPSVSPTDPQAAKKMAFISSLISAQLWHDIRVDFGYNGEAMGETVAWAISTLLKNV